MMKDEEFESIIKSCGDRAYNVAYRFTGNEHDASDLVQEAFMRAFQHRAQYDPSRPFEGWLYQILRNIYLDTLKRAEHRTTFSLDQVLPSEEGSLSDLLPSTESTAIDDLIQREQGDLIQSVLLSLPLHYRTAVTLCDIEGLSYDEIAYITNAPVGTVRSRIHQGRRLTRAAYERSLNQKGVPNE